MKRREKKKDKIGFFKCLKRDIFLELVPSSAPSPEPWSFFFLDSFILFTIVYPYQDGETVVGVFVYCKEMRERERARAYYETKKINERNASNGLGPTLDARGSLVHTLFPIDLVPWPFPPLYIALLRKKVR